MAHGGFITADDLKALNVKLNISAFLSGRDQLAKAEEEESLSIASVRIYFESTMRWTKTFSLIRNKIPLAFHGSIYQLRKVTCLLCKFLLSLIQKNFRRRMSWKHLKDIYYILKSTQKWNNCFKRFLKTSKEGQGEGGGAHPLPNISRSKTFFFT